MSGCDFNVDTTNEIVDFMKLCKSDADNKRKKQKINNNIYNRFKNCNGGRDDCNKQGGGHDNGKKGEESFETPASTTTEPINGQSSSSTQKVQRSIEGEGTESFNKNLVTITVTTIGSTKVDKTTVISQEIPTKTTITKTEITTTTTTTTTTITADLARFVTSSNSKIETTRTTIRTTNMFTSLTITAMETITTTDIS